MSNPSNDHQVQIPAAQGSGRRKAAATPEKHLNRFVRIVAFIERAGNGLGTLAFTWATVVLLGGFSSYLSEQDFWFATVLVFLEAVRMFSQNNRLDYQFFFRTRGAFRSPRLNRVFVIVCLTDVLVFLMAKYNDGYISLIPILIVAIILFVLGKLLCAVILKLFCDPQRRAISQWSPLVAILLLAPCLFLETSIPKEKLQTPRIVFTLLLVAVFVLTISRLQFQRITALVNNPIGRKMLFWRPVIMFLCMCAAIVILGYISSPFPRDLMGIFLILALVVESFGNLQIPAAVGRVELALGYLLKDDNTSRTVYTEKNMSASLNIFYIMVLGQGALYIVACILEFFSFIPRRFLVHRSGFRHQWGMKCINMYYSYIFEQCIAGGVLAPKIMQLTTFAMDFTNSDSATNQLYGVQMLHSFLQREPSKVLSKFSTSIKTVDTLIRMMGWTSPEDEAIRLFAAKVISNLAKSLQVVAIPGSMQNISSLLGTDNQLKRRNPLLCTYDSQEGRQYTILDTGDNQEHSQDPLLHTNNRQNSWILGCWHWMSKCCSIQKEEPFTDQDLLPVLGMSILETLADCDPDSCVEISRATDLIPKIIGYTNVAQQKILKESSLKLLRRLSNTGGEIGITLRQKMSEHPFLLRNLAEMLDDIEGSQELRKLAAEILRNLAVDKNTRQEIGRIRVIISRLIHAFLARHAPSSTYSDQSLKITAGQALALLAMESANNCSIMLKEPGYVLIRELTVMIQDDRLRYVAASLLQNLCLNARPKLSSSDLTELSHSLREVLKRIMDTEEAGELEVLIGLSSQIHSILPEDFAREPEHGQVKERFVKRLVNALNLNIKPTVHCPGIRRVIVEQVIYMMENNSRYVNCFNECGMMEALSVVEETPSKVENYRFFLGNAGFMEYSIPLSNLVARAKEEFMRSAT